MSTMDKMEEYIASVEERIFSSLSSTEFPNVREKINQLWTDITRYGPGQGGQSQMGSLGDFHIPPPPARDEEQFNWIDQGWDWMEENPWKTSLILTGIVGGSLLVGYRGVYMRVQKARKAKGLSTERRQVVVVLGGDAPHAPPLISQLEKKGYIVITSVSSHEAVDGVERQSHGYVRALVLDPNLPETVPIFLRSLNAALSRRFPITSSGDPFSSPSAHPYIHSVISLLSISKSGIHGPLEHLSLEESYLPYLNVTHITPLKVVQALLPLMRAVPYKGKKSIIFCLPATETRVGLPFSAVQSMSAAATLRAAEVLRREVQVATLTGKSEFMKNIKVVVVDVGIFDIGAPAQYQPEDVYKLMEKWTTSEKLTYGAGFASACIKAKPPTLSRWDLFKSMFSDHDPQGHGIARKPTNIKVFVDSLVGVVSGGRHTGPSFLGLNLGVGQIRTWIRGERFSIGAGASTYKLASFLPALLLDTILNIPHFLISLRNSVLTTQPYVIHPTPPQDTKPSSDSENESNKYDTSDAASEADVESNSGEPPDWISLSKSSANIAEPSTE